MRIRFTPAAALLIGLVVSSAARAESPDNVAYFEQHVRPLFEARCIKCHGEKKQEGGLRLDSASSLLSGGESGPAIIPGHPEDSLLIEAVRYESFEMPPDGRLSAQQIEHLTMWISGGALWPEGGAPLRESSGTITDADRDWWAFRPLARPSIPKPAGERWARNEIDHFVLDRMNEEEISPAPQADEVTLVRRLYFDLTGLPPTPHEMDAYLTDSSPDAWSRLIDRLLADRRYGEHWARFWLDLVRYAESDGWKADAYRPSQWRYRDYVVDAFNNDMPYPQFVAEQLAGDELAPDQPSALVAAGFLRLGIYEYNQRDAKSHWNDILNEITDVTADVFLGMGMACARCHDHKFDPLLQADYFRLRAFFEPLLWTDAVDIGSAEEQLIREQQQAAWENATAELRAQIDALTRPHHEKVRQSVVERFPLEVQTSYFTPEDSRSTWDHQMVYLIERQVTDEGGGPRKTMSKQEQEEYDRLLKELSEFDDLKPEPAPVLLTVADAPGRISPTVIPDKTGDAAIEPGVLSVLSECDASRDLTIDPQGSSSGRRTALATWIGSADNPLTTRVIVNRIWQQHFGKGIVPTASDFGHLGQRPTHPDLLDWLTVTWIEHGWSFKELHRLILNSATWRQSAHHPHEQEFAQRDPAGHLLWRARVRRLTAEQIRDAMLTATGELDPTFGGPSVETTAPRRGLYLKVFRNTPDELLHAFDRANGLVSVSDRVATTTPTQSLLMINGEQVVNRAQALSRHLLTGDHRMAADLVEEAFRRTWSRYPSTDELNDALSFIGVTADAAAESVPQESLDDFCHVLMNANQFLYVD